MRRRRQSARSIEGPRTRAREISKTVGDPPLARARFRLNHPLSAPRALATRANDVTYPLSEVLNTTSPTCVALAPNDRPFHTLPSSKTKRQSRSSHGFFAVALARATAARRAALRRVGSERAGVARVSGVGFELSIAFARAPRCEAPARAAAIRIAASARVFHGLL